jgi:flagellar secretion chaperone FliS
MSGFARNSQVAAYQSVLVHGAAADAHGLVLMLMNAAVERMSAAQGCIERGEIVRKAKLLHNCVNILAELRGSLDHENGGPVAQNLSDLYDYMVRRLLLANAENNVSCIAEVLNLLGEIRSAWVAIGPQVRKRAAA